MTIIRQVLRDKAMAKENEKYKEVDAAIAELNQKNKPAGLSTLRREGNSLFARDTYPPRPGSNKSAPHQQDLSLGLRAEKHDVKKAGVKIKEIAGDLAKGTFDWFNFLPPAKVAKIKATLAGDITKICDWIVLLEKKYFERKKRNPTTEETFKNHTAAPLRRLPQEEPLTLVVCHGVFDR